MKQLLKIFKKRFVISGFAFVFLLMTHCNKMNKETEADVSAISDNSNASADFQKAAAEVAAFKKGKGLKEDGRSLEEKIVSNLDVARQVLKQSEAAGKYLKAVFHIDKEKGLCMVAFEPITREQQQQIKQISERQKKENRMKRGIIDCSDNDEAKAYKCAIGALMDCQNRGGRGYVVCYDCIVLCDEKEKENRFLSIDY